MPDQRFEPRRDKMPRLMVPRGMRYARQPAIGYQMFIRFRPGRQRSIGLHPVSVSGFVAPLRESGHDLGVRSRAAKGLHSLFAFPCGESPESAVGIKEKSSAQEPGRVLGLALREKRLPDEGWKIGY